MLKVQGLVAPGVGPVGFDLPSGEALAVMGPSGAGKTRLLRAIADLDPCDGSITLDGEEFRGFDAPEWRRRVTFVPATPGWWASRVEAHIPPTQESRAQDLLARLCLPADALGWSVTRLSTGESARLALLRALLLDPPVLLLDEPTGALDEAAGEAVEVELRDRLDAGASIVIVTHNSAQAARLTRQVLTLGPGGQVESLAA